MRLDKNSWRRFLDVMSEQWSVNLVKMRFKW